MRIQAVDQNIMNQRIQMMKSYLNHIVNKTQLSQLMNQTQITIQENLRKQLNRLKLNLRRGDSLRMIKAKKMKNSKFKLNQNKKMIMQVRIIKKS
jgi:methionyl-tRNA formyltransferase